MSTITIIGNLAGAVELRYTPSGKPVANLRVLESMRHQDESGQWVDDDPQAWAVTVWGDPAISAAQQLQKGHRVIVVGTTTQRPHVTQGAFTVQETQVTAKEIGRSVRFLPKDTH